MAEGGAGRGGGAGVASALGGEVIRHYCLRHSVVLRASRVTFVNVHDAPGEQDTLYTMITLHLNQWSTDLTSVEFVKSLVRSSCVKEINKAKWKPPKRKEEVGQLTIYPLHRTATYTSRTGTETLVYQLIKLI